MEQVESLEALIHSEVQLQGERRAGERAKRTEELKSLAAEIKETVALGPEIYAEFTSQFGNPNARPEVVKRHIEGIRAAGVERAFVSSDTGQLNSNWQPDALANAAKALRANGFTERELDLLFKINPAKILGIAPPVGTR